MCERRKHQRLPTTLEDVRLGDVCAPATTTTTTTAARVVETDVMQLGAYLPPATQRRKTNHQHTDRKRPTIQQTEPREAPPTHGVDRRQQSITEENQSPPPAANRSNHGFFSGSQLLPE